MSNISNILSEAKQLAGVKEFFDGEIVRFSDICDKPFYFRGTDMTHTKYGERLIVCGSWKYEDGVFVDKIKFFTGSERLKKIFTALDNNQDIIGARLKIIKVHGNMFDVVEG